MSSMQIGLRTEKSKDNPFGYIHIDSIPATEVCVLCLGGDGTITDRDANRDAKIIDNEIIHYMPTKVPVYSVTYPDDKKNKALARKIEFIRRHTDVLSSKSEIEKTLSYASEENANPQYINQLFERVILPRISLMNGKGKLPTDEACKRIRKLNIVANCSGGYVALKLEEKMQKAMKELGYNVSDCKKIQSQLLIVAHSPACPLGVSKSQYVSFLSAADFIHPKASISRFGNNFFNRYIYDRMMEDRQKIDAEQEHNIDIAAKKRKFELKPCFFPNQQGNFFLIKQKYDYGPEVFQVDTREHEVINFQDASQTIDGKLMMYYRYNVIRNGISNSLQQDKNFVPLPMIDDLVLGQNTQHHDKEKETMLKIRENGKQLRNEVIMHAKLYRANQLKSER